MVNFTCPTCSLTVEEQEMQKHLSSTRHKSVIYDPSSETLECERCHDSNIHQLTIIRYGGSDIAMLCQTCFAKEDEKPSTQYTLQNGSILRNVENYLRVRDLSCQFCGNNKHLHVSKLNTNLVVCYKCFLEKQYEANDFIKETDENFLYVLLNTKENVKASTKKFKRTRDSTRSKKGGRFKKTPRPTNKNRISTPSENHETLRSFQALSKQAVQKVKPEDEKQAFNGATHKSGERLGHDQKGKKDHKVPSKEKVITSKSKPNPKTKKQFEATNTRDSKPSTSKNRSETSSANPSPSQVSKGHTLPKKSKQANDIKQSPALESLPSATKNLSIEEKSKDKIDISVKKPVPRTLSQNSQTGSTQSANNKGPGTKAEKFPQKGPSSKVKPDRKENSQKIAPPTNGKPLNKFKEHAPSTTKSNPRANQNNKGPSNPSKSKDSKFSKKNDKPSNKAEPKVSGLEKPNARELKREIKDAMQKLEDPLEEHEEYEHIPRYLSNQPKLSYSSINDYFKEMCYHLYLEEKLQTSQIVNFETEWHIDNRQLFKVSIPYTEEIENLVPEKMRSKGMLPFALNQSIFVAKSSDKDNIWDCFVKDLNVIKKRGRKIELLLELHKWNNGDNFPIGSTTLSLLPCSATISRILFSMARIENPKFLKLLLGKEPIRQINFNNSLRFSKPTFNDSQKGAIQHVLNNPITVLQGPPGTGKTSTIHEIILQLLNNLKTAPILVVAASNIAIDNIAEKLKDNKDINILRIVSKEKEREYNDKHHLSDICLHNQVNEKLPLRFQETVLDMKFNRKPVSQTQYKKLLTTSNSIIEKLVAQAQVIFATTVTVGGYQLRSIKKLPVVIMDESTQSTEASTLIPLSMPGVDRFIFVGDDKQLSSFSDVPYLEQSLFERVLKNGTYTNPHILNVQYRMHPKISEFPVKTFYNGLLQDGVTTEQRSLENVNPLAFVDYGETYKESKVSNFSRRAGGGFTYSNKGEAGLVSRILKDFVFTKNIGKERIAIITPYSAQRDLIANLIQQDDILNPTNEAIEEEVDEDSLTTKKPTTIKTIVNIMISSIDAFQGRERDIIIFSCVRSNNENTIGFVRDRRRLNVALTRARNSLVLVGNKSCMAQGDKLWSDLVSHVDRNGYSQTEADYFKEK